MDAQVHESVLKLEHRLCQAPCEAARLLIRARRTDSRHRRFSSANLCYRSGNVLWGCTSCIVACFRGRTRLGRTRCKMKIWRRPGLRLFAEQEAVWGCCSALLLLPSSGKTGDRLANCLGLIVTWLPHECIVGSFLWMGAWHGFGYRAGANITIHHPLGKSFLGCMLDCV